jgi:hypothetical protein
VAAQLVTQDLQQAGLEIPVGILRLKVMLAETELRVVTDRVAAVAAHLP